MLGLNDPDQNDQIYDARTALWEGSDSVADLMLVECGLSTVLDGEDGTRERTDDERYLILTASIRMLDHRINTLAKAFEALSSPDSPPIA